MKKTLILCGVYPLPENHGNPMRTMNFVRFFRQHGTVDIAYVSRQPGVPKSDLFENEYPLELKEFPRSFGGRVSRFMRGIPAPIYDFSGESKRMMLSLITSRNYDYILTRYLHSTSILAGIPVDYRRKVIIDFDDILSGTWYDQQFGALQGPYKKFVAILNRKLLASYERKCLSYGASLVSSENDRTKFIHFCKEQNIYVVPNIYDDKSFEKYFFGDGFANNNILLFVGNLSYNPNVQGLKWFIDSVFPGFRKAYPDGKIMIVGRSPSEDIQRLSQIVPGIELYADVKDVKEYYKKCRHLSFRSAGEAEPA
jgi:polysaccharide biosynthesis protein PslH